MELSKFKASVRYMRALPALLLAVTVSSACSVMPFQGNSDRGDSRWVATDADPDTDERKATNSDAPDEYVAHGPGAPGNPRENPGGERTGTAGLTDTAASHEDAMRGQQVNKDGQDARPAFDHDRRRDVEYRWLRERAMLSKQSGDLQEAERYLSRALDLRPDMANEDVREMLDEVRSLLSRGEEIAPRWANLPAAAQQEYEIEADRTYREAKGHEASGRWSEAIDSWERLRRIVRYAPYGAELSRNYDSVARAGQERARIELQRQRRVLEEEAQRRERRLRDLEVQAEEERRREEIVELWRQAIYNLELRRFTTASEIVDRVLDLDPQFREAERLKAEIRDRRLMQMNREAFRARIEGYQEVMRQLREVMVPYTETVRYPTGLLAERIRSRRDRASDAVELDPEIQRIESILRTRVIPLVYDEVPLRDVIAEIRRNANVPLRLDRDVERDAGDEPITINLEDLPVGSGLNIILDDLGLRTQYRFGVLFVVDRDADADAGSVVTRVHDIRDLTFNIQEFQGPELRLRDDTDGGPGPAPPRWPGDDDALDPHRIEELIEETVAPFTWDMPNSISFFNGQLIATHTPQVQAELRDFLDELRRVAGLMVNIEVRFISVSDDFLQDFGIDFRGLGGPSNVPNQANLVLEDVTSGPEDLAGGQFDNGAGGIAPANPTAGIFFNNQDPNSPPVNFNQDVRGRFEHIFDNSLGNMLSSTGGFAMQFAYFVDLTQINAVIHAVQKQRKARVLTAPRLTAFNTQRANITVVNQIPYIADFDVNVAATAAIANPIVRTILDGMVLDVMPTISNDRRFITIEVQPTVAELVLPMPTFTTTLGPTATVTLQIPEIRLQTAQTTVRVPDGGAVVIAGLKTVRDKWVESGVPILSDIPLLGVLFRRQGRSKEQFNLVIVVHARVIDLNDEERRRPGW
jgi:type II secretory pathway component GspD/PulD (secretin)/tetratricopeptide (TPR) repeat protein